MFIFGDLIGKVACLILYLFIWIRNLVFPLLWYQTFQKKPKVFGLLFGNDEMKISSELLKSIPKLPSHIAFIFPDESVISEDVVLCLIKWASDCRCSVISFYDMQGKSKLLARQIQKFKPADSLRLIIHSSFCSYQSDESMFFFNFVIAVRL